MKNDLENNQVPNDKEEKSKKSLNETINDLKKGANDAIHNKVLQHVVIGTIIVVIIITIMTSKSIFSKPNDESKAKQETTTTAFFSSSTSIARANTASKNNSSSSYFYVTKDDKEVTIDSKGNILAEGRAVFLNDEYYMLFENTLGQNNKLMSGKDTIYEYPCGKHKAAYIEENILYASTATQDGPGLWNSYVFAYNLKTKTELWRVKGELFATLDEYDSSLFTPYIHASSDKNISQYSDTYNYNLGIAHDGHIIYGNDENKYYSTKSNYYLIESADNIKIYDLNNNYISEITIAEDSNEKSLTKVLENGMTIIYENKQYNLYGLNGEVFLNNIYPNGMYVNPAKDILIVQSKNNNNNYILYHNNQEIFQSERYEVYGDYILLFSNNKTKQPKLYNMNNNTLSDDLIIDIYSISKGNYIKGYSILATDHPNNKDNPKYYVYTSSYDKKLESNNKLVPVSEEEVLEVVSEKEYNLININTLNKKKLNVNGTLIFVTENTICTLKNNTYSLTSLN